MNLFFAIYVLVGLLGAGGFVVLYAVHPMTRQSWWRRPVGRNLMAYSASSVFLYLSATINLWFPDWQYKNVARVVIAVSLVVVVWWRLALLIREIRTWNRKKAEEDEYIDN